ncbi:hypothetical protein Q0M94_19255 (plasmid) [Deinococcus radiomollis]|uniref:hypothetical protein n=1 Tax=Deinococcus radiomollis TaxID=468916 RepID=UPI0038914FC3
MTTLTLDITEAVNKLIGSHYGLTEADAINLVKQELVIGVAGKATLFTDASQYVITAVAADGTKSEVGAQPISRFATTADLKNFVRSGYSYTNADSYEVLPCTPAGAAIKFFSGPLDQYVTLQAGAAKAYSPNATITLGKTKPQKLAVCNLSVMGGFNVVHPDASETGSGTFVGDFDLTAYNILVTDSFVIHAFRDDGTAGPIKVGISTVDA